MVDVLQDTDSIPMVDRAIRILKEIYESDVPVGVSELSNGLGLPKATVYRILKTLHNRNVIEKNDDDKYSLGLLFIEYSEKVKSEISLNTIAKPFMTEAAERTGEFINLGILCEDTVVTILNVNGERSALVSRLIPVCPLHCSSMGKIFLSSQTEEEIKEYFRKHFQKRTQYTIATYNEFILEKNKIVSSGVSYDNEEYEYGLGCIAAPLYSCEDKIIGAISVSGPLSRMKIKGMDSIENCIREAANQINGKLKLAHISTM